jgi:hypothetical protein
MKKNFILIISFVLLAFTACNSDDNNEESSVAVAFSESSYNLTSATTPVQIKFSEPAPAAGTITLSYTETAVAYSTDYTTAPAAVEKKITLPFVQNATSVEFNFNKLKNATATEVKNVIFKITGTSIGAQIVGNKTIQLNFNEAASLGSALSAEVGGPGQPNQVYVDLSTGKLTSVVRTSWDLGFYSGNEFRLVLNGSLKMAAKQLATANIDEVQVADETMIIGQGQGISTQVDDASGNILVTAIAEVSATDANNKVYLINMGNNPAATAELGSEGVGTGTFRGWKKIRVLKSGSDYKIQYADIAATTHEEVIISKNSAYNFTFFSLLDKKAVSGEPQKNQWDLNFSAFVNVIPGGPGGALVPYHYADYVVTNTKGGAQAYQVLTTAFEYDNFTLANVDTTKFNNDQRNIGSNWRGTSVPGPNGTPVSQFVLRTDRFYVVKDPGGNIYKLKFTGGTKENGERGYPKFQYSILK